MTLFTKTGEGELEEVLHWDLLREPFKEKSMVQSFLRKARALDFLLCLWAIISHLWLCTVIRIVYILQRPISLTPLGSASQTHNLFAQP